MIRAFKTFGPPEIEGFNGAAWGHDDATPLISYTDGYIPHGAPFVASPEWSECFAIIVDAGSHAPDVGDLTASIHYVDDDLHSYHYEYKFAGRPDADGFAAAARVVTAMLADLPSHDGLKDQGWSYFVDSRKED